MPHVVEELVAPLLARRVVAECHLRSEPFGHDVEQRLFRRGQEHLVDGGLRPQGLPRRQPPLRRPRPRAEGKHQLGHLADGRWVQSAGGRRLHQLFETPLQVGGALPDAVLRS